MTATPDTIAALVLGHFDQLPTKRKPLVRDNGVHEWVPLSAIVAQAGDGKLTCLSLATGMKCLPHAKLPRAQGNVLHDWHAEVLAIRAFNRFVLDEARTLLSGGPAACSPFLRRRDESEMQRIESLDSANGDCRGPDHEQSKEACASSWHAQPFAWRDDVTLHMYCSEAPCGDASMELTMAAQDDASPWEIPASLAPPLPSSSSSPPPSSSISQQQQHPGPLPGRSYFSRLGAVRLKPSRADAPPTLSKSCSDKLALAQCTSLLNSLASLLVCPSNTYLESIVLPASQRSSTGCRRAFSASGRMAGAREYSGQWCGGYRFRGFRVDATDLEFAWSRRSVEARAGGRLAASNLAVAWTGHGLEEASLGGTLQGRKAFDVKGASFASRRKMWALSLEVAGMLGVGMLHVKDALTAANYGEVKKSSLLAARRRVKQDVQAGSLRGWARNEGDDNFIL
ncbi:hypothetical protein KJ359_008406 [Pestalotiopsis sp. 9143b]|nr:hypothetical protein KJ359_008406 [Pestalotiopsis sp. 9143b]